MDLMDNGTFQVVTIVCLGISCGIFCIILFVLKKKGANIQSNKVILTVALLVLPVALLPMWFHPRVSMSFKFILTALSVAVAVANFFAIDRGGKVFRQYFGIETEQDRRENEKKKIK